MDTAEHRKLVERFIAIADPYEIPADVLIKWANIQAEDFQRWPKRAGTYWPDHYVRSAVTYPASFALPRHSGKVMLPKRRQRPSKRERMHKAAQS